MLQDPIAIIKKVLTPKDVITKILKLKYVNGLACPKCGGIHIIKFGKMKKNQRYRCKDCGKTFSDFIFTPLYRTHYFEKWALFIECMINGLSLRKCEEVLEVSYVSLFYWRHKILSALGGKEEEFDKFEADVSIDNMDVFYSEKGNKNISHTNSRRCGANEIFLNNACEDKRYILTAMDKSGHRLSKVVNITDLHMAGLNNILGRYLSQSNKFVIKGLRYFVGYARWRHIDFHTIKFGEVSKAREFNMMFQSWLSRFRGVASKYMKNYLVWFEYLCSIQFSDNEENVCKMLIDACTSNTFNAMMAS